MTSGLLTRILLIVALVLSGSVPAGMMRVQSGHGMRLVLCTPDGTREVWLADDGTVTPAGPTEGQTGGDHDRPHCVQVALDLPDWSLPAPVPVRWRLRPASPSLPSHQIGHRPATARPHLSRAPPSAA